MTTGIDIRDAIDRKALVSVIEKFSERHENHEIPKNQKKYRDLIPSKGPSAGQQYAFEVDLDKCTGCKACVTACHNENGLDPDETWRSVGMIHGGTAEKPALQHVTSACHHCVEPACQQGCPTLAYTKDEVTGIVKHLDDQCFGCQYCILKCPYDVPKYNSKRGIVHKCDMCIGRLTAGEAPACARACPNGAIRITVVHKEDVKKTPRDYVRIADAPDSDYTYPTTRYISGRGLPAGMESTDYYDFKPEHSHMPLVIMLVLTQLSVGAFFADFAAKYFLNSTLHQTYSWFHVPLALGFGLLALGASLLHLGRPYLAFRAVLGFRTSWLSREIISFGLFAQAACAYALLRHTDAGFALEALVLTSGMTGIYCSVMVYRDTQRVFWNKPATLVKFVLTGVILGFAVLLLTSAALSYFHPEIVYAAAMEDIGRYCVTTIFACTAVKLLIEASIFLHLLEGTLSPLKKTALLMSGVLSAFTRWRFALSAAGGIGLPLLFMQLDDVRHPGASVSFAVLIFVLSLAGEILERYLFFRAVVALKMPGKNHA